MLKTELRFFNEFPSVVQAGKTTEITIAPNRKCCSFPEKQYKIRVVPREKRDIPRNQAYNILGNTFNELIVEPKDGKLVFSYEFKDEQEYRIIIFGDQDKRLYTFMIYALADDLYGTVPFRGDLHMHSDHSDGLGSLCELVSNYREQGYDFVCVTDHHKHYPSVMAKEMFASVDTGLTIFPGEEVHNCDMGYIHIINFGGKYSVNEIIESDYEALVEKIRKVADKLEVPEGIDAFEVALRGWICDEIRKSGGKAIYPHPFWTICDEYHVETDMSLYTLKSGMYDIYELFGGCTVTENQIQQAMYQELRTEGVDLPIVGSTDTHDFVKGSCFFDWYNTIVFAKDKDGIVDAIMNKYSVAVQNTGVDAPQAYGKFRLIKYAYFLLENFYPVYETYTKDIGSLMRAYIAYGDCKESLEGVNEKAQEFKKKYFGIE